MFKRDSAPVLPVPDAKIKLTLECNESRISKWRLASWANASRNAMCFCKSPPNKISCWAKSSLLKRSENHMGGCPAGVMKPPIPQTCWSAKASAEASPSQRGLGRMLTTHWPDESHWSNNPRTRRELGESFLVGLAGSRMRIQIRLGAIGTFKRSCMLCTT